MSSSSSSGLNVLQGSVTNFTETHRSMNIASPEPVVRFPAHTNHSTATSVNQVGNIAGDPSLQVLLNSFASLYNPGQNSGNSNLSAESLVEDQSDAGEQVSDTRQQPSISQLSEEALD